MHRCAESTAKEDGDETLKRPLVRTGHRLAGRMHREDGCTDIHRAHRHVGREHRAERRAAAHVRAVEEHLIRDGVCLAERLRHRNGLCIARICLAAGRLDRHAAAKARYIRQISFLGCIGVQRMGDVEREQEPAREVGKIGILSVAE